MSVPSFKECSTLYTDKQSNYFENVYFGTEGPCPQFPPFPMDMHLGGGTFEQTTCVSSEAALFTGLLAIHMLQFRISLLQSDFQTRHNPTRIGRRCLPTVNYIDKCWYKAAKPEVPPLNSPRLCSYKLKVTGLKNNYSQAYFCIFDLERILVKACTWLRFRILLHVGLQTYGSIAR